MRPVFLLLLAAAALFPQAKPNIAVIDLTGSGLSPSDLVTLSNRLRTELFETQKFIVVERGQMETVLKEQGFQQSGCTDAACAVEAGQLLNVDQIVLGSIDKISRVYSINLRAVSVKDGAIAKNVKTDLVDAEIEDLMLKGLRKAARQLAGLETTEEVATPTALRGRKVVKYKGYKSGPAGSLNLAVRPGDAEVFVDDSSYGKGSMVIDYVPEGMHKVLVTRAGYRKLREKAEVYANQETALNISLKSETPFSFSLGAGVLMRRARFDRRMVFQTGSGSTDKYTQLDLDYLSSRPFAPAISFGWELGKKYIGFSFYTMPKFNSDRKFLNAARDTFPMEATSQVFGTFFDFNRSVLTVPGIVSLSPGFCGGYLMQKNFLHPGDARRPGDSLYYHYQSDNDEGVQYKYFGGPLFCLKAGYKHVFLAFTDRFLMGISNNLSSGTMVNAPIDPYSTIPASSTPGNSTSFAVQNIVAAGLLFRF